MILLITYPIEIPSECLFGVNDEDYFFNFYFYYYSNYLTESDYFLSIEFSSNPYPDWNIFYQEEISESSIQEFTWDTFSVGISFPILKAANYLENYRKIKILQIKYIEFQEGNDSICGPQPFWIGFRFQGSDLFADASIALDDIFASCTQKENWDDDSGDNDALDDDTVDDDVIADDDFSDDDLDDDMTDDDQSDDDTSGSDTSDDDDSGKACGC